MKAVRGPLPQINPMPTAGIDLENVDIWIRKMIVSLLESGEFNSLSKKRMILLRLQNTQQNI
ncbi:hypothetical protein [Lysinibacillus halotolerans]|uniref:hypothetical protein n=1 Tax=Lysinibacillus halotolerans TaxID=1368476 RepID=UPI0011CE6659|nr:hypothetical protein [Lysinibacillus halotolerans]